MDILKIQINVILETTASKRKRRRISSMCVFRGSNSVVTSIKTGIIIYSF